jgi:hypothetical protein
MKSPYIRLAQKDPARHAGGMVKKRRRKREPIDELIDALVWMRRQKQDHLVRVTKRRERLGRGLARLALGDRDENALDTSAQEHEPETQLSFRLPS